MGAETTVTVEKARATSGKPRTTSWQLKEMLTAWIFSLPAFLLLLVFLIIPFFMAIYFSFTNQTLIPGPIPTEFVGFPWQFWRIRKFGVSTSFALFTLVRWSPR